MSQQQIFQPTKAEGAQPGPHYEYDTLPNGPCSRYLVLQTANTEDEPLACSLHTAHLNEFPHFEAISYAWGLPVKNRIITCDGKIIRITTNLCEALLQVRSTDKPRTLWVDSICIDQANLEEQAHQVSLMHRIYEQSDCTLICLGLSGHLHAHVVADLVAEVHRMIRSVFEEATFDWTPNSFPFPDKGDPLLSHSGWQSFGVLLQEPWFRRGWVVQEAALSQHSIILWATTEIEWVEIVRAYIWRIRRALQLPDTQLWLSDLHLQEFYGRRRREAVTFRPEGAIEPFTFLEILDCARWLGVTDPRDRVYAFMSLSSPTRPFPTLRPDYVAPYIHIYRDLASEYLRMSGDLGILHFVQNDNITLDCGFATWIPRWNMNLYGNHTSNLNNYNRYSRRITSQLSPHKITVSIDQTILEVRAVVIDTVTLVAQGFNKNYTTLNDVASLWDTVSKRSTSLPYSCAPLRAFVTTFRCGVYRGRLKEWQTLESAYMRFLQHELSEGDVLHDDAKSFHESRMEDVHNKSFIVTDRGYYGLAPQIVQERDLCAIIFGTRSPFILRKADQPGHYKLIGSVLLLSKQLDHNEYPNVLGRNESCYDWTEWGLKEENISLC